MVNEKKISLCMVVYNRADLVKRAIDSVKAIVDEVVIVDQGSDPTESKQLQELAHVYHRTTNKGNADPDRQFCYALATNDYLLALDADEVVPEDTVEKLKWLFSYDFDVVWFVFDNRVIFEDAEVAIGDILGDDPHPRLWRRAANVIWPAEAHKFPEMRTDRQIFCDSRFLHSRQLTDIIKTHLRRRNFIDRNAQKTEREFVRALMRKFSLDVQKRLNNMFQELPVYLKD